MCGRLRDESPGFWSDWVRAIKGPIDHLELAFVDSNEKITSFYITYGGKTAAYKPRNFHKWVEEYEAVYWYQLTDITLQEEWVLREYCEKQAQRKIPISTLTMIRSAAPFSMYEWMTPYILPLIEPGVYETIVEPDRVVKPHFCASLTVDALQQIGRYRGVDPYRCTANDALEYYPKKKLVDDPKILSAHGDSSIPRIGRSKLWGKTHPHNLV